MQERIRLQRDYPKFLITTIKKVILRNKGRILQEIEETRELYELLMKWRSGEPLSENEKEAVKSQLIDICKAIPAITIFIIPFGGLVLLLLIKLLPFNLLPTAFNEPDRFNEGPEFSEEVHS